MPEIRPLTSAVAEVQADVVAVFAVKGEDAAEPARDAAALGETLGIDMATELKGIGFEGKLGTVARIPTRGRTPARLILVVGIGESQKATLETLRRAAGTAARQSNKDATLAVVVPGDLIDAPAGARISAVTEGAGLGAYAFTKYRTKTNDLPSLETILVVPGEGVDTSALDTAVNRARLVVDAVSLARDLINTPPADKRPPALADRVAELLRDKPVEVRIFDEGQLAEGGFGGILGVGRGSSAPPRLVELRYTPDGASSSVVLVGKGITFDSGGLSLKPATSMSTMKSDMSGAAAVVAVLSVLADLGVNVNVTGLLALAENMPSGEATRVSDVITHRGGKTAEVMNTDAEGRLVLGDALAYGAESNPDAMIDLATLTGAQIVALGMNISAMMGTDEALLDEVRGAADLAGEKVWPLPLPDEYADHLKSEVADIKNIGKPMQAGTIIGGMYLKNFVGDIPWVHLDIAGPAFTEEGDSFYTPKGGTGVGVRTLLELLMSRSNAPVEAD